MASHKPTLDDLLAQLPETDKQLEARQPPPPADAPKKRREPDPDPGGDGSKFTAPEPELAWQLVAQVLAGGRKSVLALLERVHHPADPAFQNYRAEYLLHCLVLHVGTPGGRKHRKLVVDALADHIRRPTLSVAKRQMFIQELQWIADSRAIDYLAHLLLEEDLCEPASAALLAIGEKTAPAFRKAYPRTAGKPRLVVTHALGHVRDARSAEALRRALDDSDTEIKLAAAWALARLADAASAENLLTLAAQSAGYAKAKASQACLLLAENMAAAGKKREARNLYATLQERSAEKYLREVASRALARLEAT